MSRLTTAGHPPHSTLELRRAETTTSTSQPQAHLQAALVDNFPGNNDNVGQSASNVADRGHDKDPNDFSPKSDTDVDLIPTFADSMTIIPYPEVIVVEV
jgi:hypothetical protein